MQSSGINYYEMFQNSPVSIWKEDFSEIKQYIDSLKKKGIHDLKTYLEEHPGKVLDLAQMVRVIEVNNVTLELYQARSKQELYQGLKPIFNKKSYDVFREELVAISEGKTQFSSEAVTKTLKGEERHILLKLAVAPGCERSLSCVFIHIIDISELRRMEEKLRESEEKYRTIIESAHDAIVVPDAETGIILEANKRSEHLIGVPQNHIVGMHFTQLYNRENKDLHRKIFQNHVKNDMFISENLVVCKMNGDKVPVSVRSNVIWLEGKKCVSAIFREMEANDTRVECGLNPENCIMKNFPAPGTIKKFTQREQEIINLIASGFSNKKISERLSISIKTVETHRARIMEKLGVHKTADLVRFAIYSGLLKSNPPEIEDK